MAGNAGEAEDRTEAATPRRLQQAREQGQVPLSRELPTLAVLAACALVMGMIAPGAARAMGGRLAVLLERAHEIELGAALCSAGLAALAGGAPFALAALLAGSAAVLLQTGFLFHLQALKVDLKRLDPVAGLRRIVGPGTLVEAGKAVVKALVAAGVLWMVLSDALPALRMASFWTAPELLDRIVRLLLQAVLATIAVQAAVAGLDVLRVRLKHARDLRMSREDLKQEMRESEGDPHLKARLKQIRLQRARRRMMAAVPKATVVVTNPTHYAIALSYDRAASGAPRVVAKGVDAVAARIRTIAEENKVPLVANPPLARALYKVELDTEIPAEHFKAVAEIIAYVWRLRGMARGRRR
ncbi:Flagellar biosynthesis protein FlhB [Rhodovastum atsumiense]|uniref:Flagellar biosynthetic protein FlhB n=1 Tax=Rhodovastum atsumiense TaxID=504468 RepID=A0A5M6IS36_9PROT|nr:flagellar type III secretion system protein FlhB [Rhodovastum atsumiense]KAA5611110.1 flagellar biosynthesis protein FlhB [Rhodovastum atsumiense]CAH2599175.1 Flagellar biosynthesis protein FlhB [Rhodovastum atsumiense]